MADATTGAEFTPSGGEQVVSRGVVSVGYAPTGKEDFLALVRVDVGDGSSAGQFAVNTGTAAFGVTNGKMALTVVSGGKTNAPLPIWQTPDSTGRVNFPIATLSEGSGVSLSDAMSSAITVASADFHLNRLQFVDPTGGDTSDARVQMQGNVSFDQLPVTNGLNGARFEVNGINYVIADKQGVTLTGLKASRSLPSDTTIGGMAVSGTISIGYTKPQPPATYGSFTVGGGVFLSSNTQGTSKGFDGVGAELNFTLGEADGKLDILSLGFTVEEEFKLFGLTVSTIPGKPIDFQWDLEQKQYEIRGGLQAEFRGNKVGVSFEEPGIVVADGELSKLSAKVTTDFELFGVKVSTGQTKGLNFGYDLAKEQFVMYGGLSLTVPTTNTTTQITAQMGTSASDPGLVIVGGKLQRLDLALSGQFDLYGLALTANGAGARWVAAEDAQHTDTIGLYGAFSADFKVFQTSTRLGTPDKPGLTIAGGKFVVDDLTFELDNAELGPITLEKMKVSYETAGTSFDLGVEVEVGLPGGWRVGGGFEFVEGRFDSISLAFQGTTGIAIGATGLFATEVAASVKNIENPSKIVVSGRVDVVYGETVKMLGRDVNLFHAEGRFTVDADAFVLDCDVQLGAYSTDNGNTWQAALGRADGKLTLDWHDSLYALHVEADGILGVFNVEGDLVFAAGRDIQLLATAEVVVPTWVPFIGGDTLAGLGFYFEHVWPQPGVGSSTTFAAWVDLDVIWPVTVGLEIVIDASGTAHYSVIGAGTVDGFKQSVAAPTDRTYTYTTDLTGVIPAAATYATVGVDWAATAPGVTIVERPKFRVQRVSAAGTQVFTEDQFAANGISFISDSRFNSKTAATIQIVGSPTDPDAPLTGQYSLLVDIKTEGGNPFTPGRGHPDVQATYHIPKATLGPRGATAPYAPPLPTVSPDAPFAVTLTGSIDEAYLAKGTVSLYRVRADDPSQRGVLIGSQPLTALPPSGGVNWTATFTVPIEGLDATEYTLYAVLTDGFSTPRPGDPAGPPAPGRAVQSGPSAAFTPVFAVQGTLLNQNGDRESGWELYLDYNSNGSRDASEPTAASNRDGFYSFTRAFDPASGWDPVPVGRPFHVRLVLPANVRNFAPIDPARPVTYQGTAAAVADYGLQEKSAIKGTVFVDRLADANPAHGRGAAGAIAYLDANGNGQRDLGEPTAVAGAGGRYAFADLAAGTYTVALDLTSLSRTTPAAAYAVPAGTAGNQTDDYTYGQSFRVDRPTVVTDLGVFDSKGDGIAGTMTAVLFDATTKAAVARLTFTPSAPGTLRGGTRFLPLATPITLMPGFVGVIAVYGVSAADPVGNNFYRDPKAPPPWTSDAGSGQLSFLGGYYSGTPNTFPTTKDASPYPNPYAAGSFLFREAPWAATAPGATPYTVTVGAGGYDLREGKDFGVLPPSFIAGTVSGHALSGGQLRPGTDPLAGWAVELLADTPIARIDAGGGAAGGYNTDTDFTGGTSGETAAEIDTSRVLNPAPQAVYQNNRYGQNRTAFSYRLTGLTPQAPFGVRLHFAEPYWGAPGERQFQVTINGQRVLSEFDVFQAAGGKNTAVVRSFDTFADAGGGATIEFTPGQFGDPFVNGIELLRPGAVVATTTTDAQGNYVFVQHAPGDYTVRESLPAGWRQASPYHSDLAFDTSPLPPEAAGSEPMVADFNNDGYLDFAVIGKSNTSDPIYTLYVLLNQKNGTFSFAFKVDYSKRISVAAADLNGDGWVDLAVLVKPDGASAYLNAYLNTQRKGAAVFQSTVDFWKLPAALKSPAGDLSYLTRADLNADGLDDLLLGCSTTASTSASVLVLMNAPQAAGRTVTEYKLPRVNLGNDKYGAGPMVAADFNGDGHLDVFVNGGMTSLEYSHLNLALGDGKGHLDPWQSYALPDATGSNQGPTAAGDITGAGLPSLAILSGGYSATFKEWEYDANYLFNRGGRLDVRFGFSQTQVPLAPAPTRVLVTDVSGDLKPDLVYLLAGGTGVDSILVYLNVGTEPYYELAGPLVYPIDGPFEAEDLAVADVNNDGLQDLLVTGPSGGRLVLNRSSLNQPGLPVVLGAGSVTAGADFVNVQTPGTAAVHGQVFEDADRSGGRSTAETGTAGTFVFVDLNRNRRYDAEEPSAATIAGGYYTIPGLADGVYSVGLVAEDGWRAATMGHEFAEVAITGNVPVQVDIGRVRRLLADVDPFDVRVGETLNGHVPLATASRRLTFSLEGPVPGGLSVNPATGVLAWAPTPDAVGTHTVTVRARDPYDPLFTETIPVTIRVASSPAPPVVPPVVRPAPTVVVGSGNGLARVFSAAAPRLTLTPFDGFAGEVRVATGDVNGDGVPDWIVAAGPGGGPHVKVFDGATATELASFFAFEPSFTGGVFVAAGDVDGDGAADLVVGAGAGGGPRVRVFGGRDRAVLADFFAFEPGFRGGVTVASGDVDGDGAADLVVGAGAGGGPRVRLIGGRTLTDLASIFVFEDTLRNGVFVASGDLDGDGAAEVVAGGGPGGGPRVFALSGKDLVQSGAQVVRANFFAGDATSRGGVRVAVKDLDGDGRGDLVAGAGAGSRVTTYLGKDVTAQGTPPEQLGFDAFPGFAGGVFVG